MLQLSKVVGSGDVALALTKTTPLKPLVLNIEVGPNIVPEPAVQILVMQLPTLVPRYFWKPRRNNYASLKAPLVLARNFFGAASL